MGESEAESSLVHTLAIHSARPSKHLSFSPSFQPQILIHVCFSSREDVCKCGHLKTDHAAEAIKPEDYTGKSWDKHRHVREVPTDAFGDIHFGGLGQRTGKYARVSTDTDPEVLYNLLTEQWKLSPPNLLISVTGGAKNFYLKARLKNMFHRGLIKVAQTTGAWIITGGTHVGVMKHVGHAVRDYALSSSSMQGQVVAIGVATWGVIHNRDTLMSPEGCFPAHYSMDNTNQGRLSLLDNNHTHFLLVDDGTQGLYGVEIELRGRLERCITRKHLGNKGAVTANAPGHYRISGLTIPAVCVVLDGGPGTLNTMYNAMLNGTPCVVLDGSGRIADVVAQVAGMPVTRVTISLIHQLMKKFFGQEYETFDDLKILKTSESLGVEYWKRQLELAIAWNRVDIAKTEIFTEESQWKSSDLHRAMFSALVGNKPQFVSLLVENGVSLRDFLQDEQTLCELYRQLPSCFFLHKLAKRVHGSNPPLKAHDAEAQRDPGTDLFLWAVVQSSRELAEIAWEQCRDCTCGALAASKILKKMADEGSDVDEAAEMKELAAHYEKHAIGVFTECHNSDEERAEKLLVRVSPFWGRTTCLRFALEADDENFVAHSGVQALLTRTWCGQLSVDNPVWRVMICIVFFPLIYTGFLVFRSHLKPLGRWSRLVCLYSSPQVKFYLNIVSYFAFLLLFAVVLMIDFQPTPSPGEMLLYIWLLSLVFEEVRQMYINELWNILDVLSITLFIIGLVFRLTSELFYAGKIVLCIDFVVFCLRLMAIFTISRTLGPKIIIVKRMMMDMFFFMFLLSIWVVAYGVAKQGILIENESRLDWIVRGVVYQPYLVIFGTFPTDIDKTTFDITSCSINGTDPLKPKCPMLDENQTPVFPEWLTIIMICVYLLFANILLLNLLIAIFNFTFQEVQDNTDRIWKFQRYELIKEYYSRPALPPPFCILSHLYLFVRKMTLCGTSTMSREFKNKLPQTEEEELLSWEALMKDKYLLSSQMEQSQNMELFFYYIIIIIIIIIICFFIIYYY
uniref:Transient receptor potential cation channel, subfamily M, member 2 n=1 Tax=Anabas testudineus TaxID=64144 RepID=A0A3Q1J6J4_ANATE